MESTKLLISGMNCEKCVEHVTKAIRGVAGVKGVIVSLAHGSALIRHEHAEVTKIVNAVKSAGYEASVEK